MLVFLKRNAQLLVSIYLIILILLATLPINGSESTANKTFVAEIRLDYIIHATFLIPWMSFLLLFDWKTKKVYVIWFLVGSLIAFFIEYIQYFLPYRTYNILDLLNNFLGLFLGILIWIIILISKSIYFK
ncbi:VanZ family protein [Emticicia sp.]|uniref:VanZ family protein n=1 Tax=Emticicia sp. TaxID=1930953 RepID=UPI00375140D8